VRKREWGLSSRGVFSTILKGRDTVTDGASTHQRAIGCVIVNEEPDAGVDAGSTGIGWYHQQQQSPPAAGSDAALGPP
jgi:hypothetical protein